MTSLANDSSTIAELVAALNRLNVVVEELTRDTNRFSTRPAKNHDKDSSPIMVQPGSIDQQDILAYDPLQPSMIPAPDETTPPPPRPTSPSRDTIHSMTPVPPSILPLSPSNLPPSLSLDPPTPDEVNRYVESVTSTDGRWYLVTSGRRVGVFPSWAETAPLVLGCSGAIYRRLNDRNAAANAYRLAWSQSIVTHRT